jgi:hypothetical protein
VTLRDSPQLKGYGAAVRLTLVCALGFLLASGCAHGTTLPEAAGRLEHDAHDVLDEGARRLGAPGARPAIAVNDRRSCGGGRARQVWQGDVPLRRGPGSRLDLDNATDVSIGLARAHGYRLEGPPVHAAGFRRFTMVHDGPGVRLVVRVQGGHRSLLRVDATTPCLPRG